MDPATMSKVDQANEVLNANAHFANHLYSFITPMSLKCAVELGIADAIHRHSKPMTISDLSVALPIHPQKAKFIPKLMRILTHSGYFSYDKIPGTTNQDDAYGYSLTRASQLLLKDHPFSVKPYLLFILDPLLVNPWIRLSDWFRNDDNTPYETANGGMAVWECTRSHPELNKVLNDTMAADSKMVASVLVSNELAGEIFEGVESLVDVGGGLGEMAKAISTAFPHIKCVVLDLPHVVEGLEGDHNLSFIPGDMFEAIPPANAILLKWILHDWSDEYSVKILKQSKRAITSNGCGDGQGKVIIIDVVMDENQNEEDYKKRETQMFYDMEMMTLVGGKERTKREWEKLFLDAGFNRGFNIYPLLGFRSVIEVYP